jgi:GNAT superfamily N-acetyltransferase
MKNWNILVDNMVNNIVGDQFICHVSYDDWGVFIIVMEKQGRGIARTYTLNEDKETIYFDWLSVETNHRNKGIGMALFNHHLDLFKILNDIGIKMDSRLWVKRDSWMYEWYKRKGYVETHEYEEEEGCVWMLKEF